MASKSATFDEVCKTLGVLHPNRDLIEVRTKFPKTDKSDGSVFVGRSRNHGEIAKWVELVNGEAHVFAQLNSLPPGSLWEPMPLNSSSYDCEAVKDDNFTRFSWLYIDVDADREEGCAASWDDIAAVKPRVKEIVTYLRGYGFPDPIVAFSGNGYHLLYKTDLPKTDDFTFAYWAMTKAVAKEFSTDAQPHGISHVLRLYGSINPKGGRQTRIVSVPGTISCVTAKSLKELVAASGFRRRGDVTVAGDDAKLEEFLVDHCELEVESQPYNGGTKWLLSECPFCGMKKKGAAAVIKYTTGAMWFGCVHEPTCGDIHWKEFRERMEEEHGKFSFMKED